MGRPKQTSKKREKEKEKLKKKKEKEQRKQERKKNSTKGMGLDIATVRVDADSSPFVLEGLPQETAKEQQAHSATKTGNVADTIKKGRISYFNEQKGYGFIRDLNVRENLFFNVGDLRCPIKLNDLVSFVKVKGQRGSMAADIDKIEQGSK